MSTRGRQVVKIGGILVNVVFECPLRMPKSKSTTVFRFFSIFQSVVQHGGRAKEAALIQPTALFWPARLSLKKQYRCRRKASPRSIAFLVLNVLHTFYYRQNPPAQRGATCLRSCARRQTPCSYLRKLPLQQRAMTVLKTCTTISLKQTQCCLHVKITLQTYKKQIPSCII